MATDRQKNRRLAYMMKVYCAKNAMEFWDDLISMRVKFYDQNV